MGHAKPDFDPVSLSPLSFWSGTPRERDESLRILRAERPVSYHPPAEGSMMPPEEGVGGFWAWCATRTSARSALIRRRSAPAVGSTSRTSRSMSWRRSLRFW